MSRFLEALQSGRVLLMDGAMGTELQRAGLKEDECGELWNLTHPERVLAIHQAYVAAGAECVLTNTFQANPSELARRQVREPVARINQAALSLARSAAGPDRFVLGDMGPVPNRRPRFTYSDPEAIREMLPSLNQGDALLLETWSDRWVLTIAAICRVYTAEDPKPLLLSLTYQRDSKGKLCTYSGHPPEALAATTRAYGVNALGVNCGPEIGMDEILEIVRRYRQTTDLPLFARPNAGTPKRVGDRWVYPRTPENMAARLPELLEAGVIMVGGCCGTTPEHIAAFRPVIDEWNARHGLRETH